MNGVTFLEGPSVRLRPLELGDLHRSQRWINDPRVRRFLHALHPVNLQSEQAWFQELGRGRPPRRVTLAIEPREQEVGAVGLVELAGIDWVDRRAGVGLLIGEPEWWGKGLGSEAVALLAEHAFRDLGLHRLEAEVFQGNERSLGLFRGLGFREEGRSREAVFRGGRWLDVLRLGLLAREWEERREAWWAKARERAPGAP